MDKVFIEALEIECVIGIHDWERRIQQPIVLDIEMGFDQRKPAASDAIEDAIDYAAVAALCERVAQDGGRHLLEALVADLAERILRDFAVAEVRITCRKPGAIQKARSAGVSIFRQRGGRETGCS